ncbi:tripartite tricarboxylate transporter substrate binding protein [Polynucleobacter kasalickyi]|uniref:Tripartite-type tricarboxylate transporter, receptor component TctC n=1 Tax=Polynucleobacter kasalickyi TaxID=1938817 RepID=A0A1W1YAH9_9BURK|nr:tripartite tricarboxylate transporter substrate binding protein [Polynucleobacter kasalickyi]SMC33149.1 Tripartite-type tricarboxylate transporter, receptor component TctC [Polynucleobacter kasalickyi]
MIKIKLTILFLLLILSPAKYAIDYPIKPVKVIVGFPPGSGADVLARVVSNKLSESMGQQFIVENRPGAGTNIGTNAVAKSTADGYTILVMTVANAINPALSTNLPFDIEKDFSPIVLAGFASNVLVINPNLGVKNITEFVELAKSKPGKLTFGSSGSGTSPHLAGELFTSKLGLNIVHVPYKGGPQALTDLLGGQIDSLFVITSTVLPHISSGKLKAIAVAGPKRTQLLPDLPTLDETVIPNFDVSTWIGFAVPTGTPNEIIVKLNQEMNKALDASDAQKKLIALGIETVGGTPNQLKVFLKEDLKKWANIAKIANIKTD